MATHCGLCKKEIEGTWEDHVAGEEHQKNLKDEKKMKAVKLEHFRDTGRLA